jgi:hypothetical protein
MPLTEFQIRNARSGEKIIQLGDDRGLYLEVPSKWIKTLALLQVE